MKYRYKPKRNFDMKIIALLVAMMTFAGFSVYEYHVLTERQNEISSLNENLADTQQSLLQKQEELELEKEENEELKSNITEREETITRLAGELGLAEEQISDLTPTSKEFAVVGVLGDGEGFVVPLEVKIVSGDGSISVNINNVDLLAGVQESVRTAVEVAEDYTHVDLSKKDITVSFVNTKDNIVTIDGDSAGAAITATIIANLQNKTLRDDVLMTGAIRSSGDVGIVGGVSAKAKAARDHGAAEFLVPEGQKVTVSNLEVIEVEDIEEVVKFLFK